MTLRILHVVDSLEFGGLERVVTDLAIGQREAGHVVWVFSIKNAGDLALELDAAGIPVIWGGKQGGADLRTLRKLRSSAFEHDIDIVHAHNFMPTYYTAAALIGTRRPTRVATCHDMGTRLGNRKLRWLFRWSLSRMAQVATVGSQVFERYRKLKMLRPQRSTTVLNGIPVERFSLSAERRLSARAKLGIPLASLVVGTVGRLVAIKNQSLLLKLVPSLVRLHPNLVLVFIGDGVLSGALRREAAELEVSEHVLFAGERTGIAELLPAFDIFVLPSLSEGMSIALLEAAATGLAIVASRVGGNPEIIHDGQTGILFEPQDSDALRAALSRFLEDPQFRAELGAAARAWVTKHASLATMCSAYESVYAAARHGR
jgi:glycosyltransferase involved in cell wall biosynthesis